jgi:hypothetical protein
MHNKSSFILFSVFLVLSIFLIQQVSACGCGIAIADMKVFNSLKETQAYLMIDIIDQTTYNEMPFFRMVSMEEPYNVTIVFPIDVVPYDVQGKRMTPNEFLSAYEIPLAEKYLDRQSFSGLLKNIGKNIGESSSGVFALSNGFFGFGALVMRASGSFGGNKMAGSIESLAIAHFEFEGGSMDIYDVSSVGTLDEFIKGLNINATDQVKELIDKYKNYFVAVLHLKVESVLSSEERAHLSECPDTTADVKRALQEKSYFTRSEINYMTAGPCQDTLQALVSRVVAGDNDLDGTLVTMKFKDTNQFFYPTSIVNSYNYPVSDQRYLIRTPSNLNVKLEQSRISQVAITQPVRWYKVISTKEDIKGKIVSAGLGVRIGDKLRLVNQVLYNNSGWLAFIFYLIIIIGPFVYYHYHKDEGFNGSDIGLTIGMFVIGGLLLAAIVAGVRKKKKFALTLLFIWLVLLIIMILSNVNQL